MTHLARVAVAGLAAVLAGGSLAQESANYPSGSVKMIVPFAPGGPTDVVARLLVDPLSARWGGKPIVIENRPGAGTLIGSNAIAKSPPDGYTLGMIVNSFMTNAATAKNPPFDANKDFSAIAVVSTQPMALVATKSFPAHTVAELVEYAKRSPALNYTSRNRALRRRDAQATRRDQHAAHQLQRQRPGAHRLDRRPGAAHVRRVAFGQVPRGRR